MTPLGSPVGQHPARVSSSRRVRSVRPGATRSASAGRRLEERPPAAQGQGVRPLHREIAAGEMEPRQGLADRAAMAGGRAADRQAVEEVDDRRGPPGEAAERLPAPVAHRLRAGQPAPGQVLHQAEEERQVGLPHPLLVQREDEGAAARVQEVIGVLDPLGDALAGQHRADVVGGDERRQLLVRDLRVDGHGYSAASPRRPRGSGKIMFSSVVTTVSTLRV